MVTDQPSAASEVERVAPTPVPVFQVQTLATASNTEESDPGQPFRRIFGWVALVSAGLWGLSMGVFLGYHSLQPDGWMVQLVERQFAALVLVPGAGLAAFCIVLVLRLSSGPLDFSALGFTFKGASGQVVLWVVCFLALVAAVKVLWVSP